VDKTAIDLFNQSRARRKKTQARYPWPLARAFLRRAPSTLTGLPAHPNDVGAFLKTTSRHKAFEKSSTAHRLAAIRERWCRHWLDVFGYGR